ncbi:MAG: outer membrane lipoprotein carrier protein LolA [Sandaracinaceae bacterium]|nr:outer membrane lipoprotein carrier protein LolA [Sandaracinaceae bacterium]
MTRSKKLVREIAFVVLALGAVEHTPAWSASEASFRPAVAEAQDATPVTAEVVAARVQAFYEQTRTVEARFQQHFWIQAHGRTISSRGTIVIQRPGRIRFDYAQPRGKVVVSTPAGFTYYEPGDDGGAGQFMRGNVDGASAALGFLTGTSDLARDFRFSLRASSAGGPEHTDALELRPRRADPHYRRIVLYVSNDASTLGVVRRVSIEDPDGNWNRFDFSGFQFNRDVNASTFEFQPPSGAREITAPGSAPAAVAPGTGTGAAGLPAPGASG